MIVKILLVEGRHDAAFVGRIMKANGYIDSKMKIGNYPKFIKGYLTSLFEGSHIEDSTLRDAVSHIFLPASSLSNSSNGDELIITFALSGDGQKERRKQLVSMFYKKFSNPMFNDSDGDDTLKIMFNLDADEYGIHERERQINEELKQSIDSEIPNLSNCSWTDFGNISWGLYIFANPKTGKGKLEDLVLPLMESDKPDLKSIVDEFLSKRPTMDYWNTKYKQYDQEKARISIMGQMEISGVNNTVLINKSGLIDDGVLQTGVYKEMFEYLIS